ncbi:hypothetical protein ACP70R_003151 [Stipagrostis hirtigluma subsp. patula]
MSAIADLGADHIDADPFSGATHDEMDEVTVTCIYDQATSEGRELQRCSTSTGGRVVVGCVPYRVRGDGSSEVEVLVISSGAAGGVRIPRGGWKLDESMDEAAQREAMEEAGVAGEVAGPALGRWFYWGRSYVDTQEGIVLPLHVTAELEWWPEMAVRRREWVSAAEAIERCPYQWMREALQRFADCLAAEPPPPPPCRWPDRSRVFGGPAVTVVAPPRPAVLGFPGPVTSSRSNVTRESGATCAFPGDDGADKELNGV